MATLPLETTMDISTLVSKALEPVRNRPRRSFGQVTDLLTGMVKSITTGLPVTPESHFDFDAPPDAMARLFDTDLGKLAVNLVGNETRTLDIIETLSVDIMLEATRTSVARISGATFQLHEDMRRLFVPGRNGLPPALLILDPETNAADTRRITDDVTIVPPLLTVRSGEAVPQSEEEVVRELFLSSPERVSIALRIAQPEVILSRRPRMERLSVPTPLLRVEKGSEESTGGIYCRDGDGAVGVTACYHGTGPVGTPVLVDGLPSQVKSANETQDIVFIPLPDGVLPRPTGGLSVLEDRTPAQYDAARFEGLRSGLTPTTISSHDAGLLRKRTSLQLKVQTPADTNRGDSGSALIDRDNRILGFAFERSAFGETPQITDWIWAANALRALGLVPL